MVDTGQLGKFPILFRKVPNLRPRPCSLEKLYFATQKNHFYVAGPLDGFPILFPNLSSSLLRRCGVTWSSAPPPPMTAASSSAPCTTRPSAAPGTSRPPSRSSYSVSRFYLLLSHAEEGQRIIIGLLMFLMLHQGVLRLVLF